MSTSSNRICISVLPTCGYSLLFYNHLATRTTESANCIFINARSIANKLNEFFALVVSHGPDILGVVESWLDSNVSDAELSIEGYDLFRCDRPGGHKGEEFCCM